MSYLRLEKSDQLGIIWLDQPDSEINTISIENLDAIDKVFDEIELDDSIRGVVLISAKKDNFIAGADIDAFLRMSSPGEAEKLSREGHALLDRIEKFPKPVVAAIHGAALGGGCEVILACHYRIASDSSKTVFGLPEVKLGLLPGGGGTQRLPALIGIQRALDLMLTGKRLFPRQAKRLGLVDELIHPYGLLNAAKQACTELIGKPKPRRKPALGFAGKLLESNPIGRNIIYRKARKMVQQQTRGNYPAPPAIIDCVEAGTEHGRSSGYATEARLFDKLVQSPQSRQLVRLFFAMNARKKNPLSKQVRKVGRIGIAGAGLMGAGIASVSVKNGLQTLLRDINGEAVAAGERSIWQELERRVRRKIITPFERDRIFSNLTGQTDLHGFDKADLVIEAVFEELELKHKVLREMEAIIREDSIFASNTSSLPIAEIAKAAKKPERVIGMHYFSPVQRMPLLEIIVTKKTPDWVRATAIEVGIRQGKTVIVVNDGPGFYTTRILAPLMNEALELLKEGIDMRRIDEAVMQFGFPVGPITLMDEVGLDVGAHVSEVMAPLFAARGIGADLLLQKITAAGFKGRKNRSGFYRYPRPGALRRSKSGKKQVNFEIYRFFGGPARKPGNEQDIQQRIALIMVNEAAYCLQEGILNRPEDGGLGAVLGLGFPPFLGGPFRWLDQMGCAQAVEILESLAQQHGPRFTPAPLLREMAAAGKHFYDR